MIAWAGDNSEARHIQSITRTLPNDGDGLIKAGYNSDEPRDWHGRWANDGDGPTADIASRSDGAALDSAVYHPGINPVDVEEVGDPKQLLLNQLRHRLQVLKEMEQWRKKGFLVTPNVTFVDPRTDTPVVSDYVVSMWVPDPDGFLLVPKPEPILVRDVKTGEGGRTGNQKQVYPYILAGGEVVPEGRNAFIAGFEVGEPTIIAEMYVEGDLPSDTVH